MNADEKKEAVVLTGAGITYARYATIKGRLKMEKVGLKFRGGSTRAALAQEFGLKPRDSHDKYIAYCETKMAELLAAMQGEK